MLKCASTTHVGSYPTHRLTVVAFAAKTPLQTPKKQGGYHVGVKDPWNSKASSPSGNVPQVQPSKTIRIAVEGCCHGELDQIYETLQRYEQQEKKKIDLLLCCGDFQAVRNVDDMHALHVPAKYKQLNTFHKYYAGRKKAPYLTLFVGGNHEAINHMWELYYGGWVAPQIYFLGYAGIINFAGYRIGGISGTYSETHYNWGRFEYPPYNVSTIRSAYHLRDVEVNRLMQVKQPVDIFLSHDWPRNIWQHGDMQALIQRKTFLATDIKNGQVGSPQLEQLLHTLQPQYWFSAHMHTKFPALVCHKAMDPKRETMSAADQLPPSPERKSNRTPITGKPKALTTKFLSLDKCLPRRDFLQVLEFEAHGPPTLQYDEEWLAILRGSHDWLRTAKYPPDPLPNVVPGSGPCVADLEFVRQALSKSHSPIPTTAFSRTAPTHDSSSKYRGSMPTSVPCNPQTMALLNMIGRPYNLDPRPAASGYTVIEERDDMSKWETKISSLIFGKAVVSGVPVSMDDEQGTEDKENE